MFGSITITGYGGRTIEVTARDTFEARDQAALERARREVSLEIRERDNTVELYVNGPFRDERDRHRGNRWDRYVAIYDFEIKVPRETQLELKTVNRGKILVTDVRGDFDVKNVNDDIELRGVAGSGRVGSRRSTGRCAYGLRRNLQKRPHSRRSTETSRSTSGTASRRTSRRRLSTASSGAPSRLS